MWLWAELFELKKSWSIRHQVIAYYFNTWISQENTIEILIQQTRFLDNFNIASWQSSS